MNLKQEIKSGHIKEIVFDFDGTLYSSRAGIEFQIKAQMRHCAAETLGVCEEEARKLLIKYNESHRAGVLGLRAYHSVDPISFYRAVYDGLDISRLEPYAGLAEQLYALSQSVHLSVFTNSNFSFTHRAIEILGLTGVFTHVITVEDNDFIRKPDPEVYMNLFTRLGVEPCELVMFDDIVSSLKVLKSLGGHTVLVGNGLKEAPGYIDLHTGHEFEKIPDFVDWSSHDITPFIASLNS